jgi:hypothetical protein
MARVKTFAAGGTVTAADLNAVQDDYEGLLATWKPTGIVRSMAFAASQTATGYMTRAGGVVTDLSTRHPADMVFYLDPAQYASGARTVQFRGYGTFFSSGQATTSFTFGVAPVASWSTGTPGAIVASVGADLAFDRQDFPAAASIGLNTGSFTIGAAGYYLIRCQIPAGSVTGAACTANLRILYRQV